MNCKVEQRGIGKPMLVVDISVGLDCSHWGLTDLYPECEKNLRNLLNTGVDFETEWCSSKKELLSARYRRKNGSVWVDVNQWMDDLWEEGDLIYDAYGWGNSEIPEEGIEYIRDIAMACGIDDTITISKEVGKSATFEDCMKAVETLMDKTDAQLNEWYEELCGIIEDYVNTTELEAEGSDENVT